LYLIIRARKNAICTASRVCALAENCGVIKAVEAVKALLKVIALQWIRVSTGRKKLREYC